MNKNTNTGQDISPNAVRNAVSGMNFEEKMPTYAPKPWSEREKDYLRKAYALGQTDVEIAAELGRTESSIRSKRNKLGLCGRGGAKWTADEDKKLMKLYEKGLTYNEIGQLIGRSYEGVSNRISKLRRAGKI